MQLDESFYQKWKKVPASEAKPSDIKEGLEYQMDITNFKAIKHDRNEWSWGASLDFDISGRGPRENQN